MDVALQRTDLYCYMCSEAKVLCEFDLCDKCSRTERYCYKCRETRVLCEFDLCDACDRRKICQDCVKRAPSKMCEMYHPIKHFFCGVRCWSESKICYVRECALQLHRRSDDR
jgi:hypothetical protein